MTNDSIAARQVALVPRPELNRAVKACVAFLALLGMGAVGGGIGILIKPDDGAMQWNVKMLAGSPFTDLLIPGLILLGSLASARWWSPALVLRGAGSLRSSPSRLVAAR
jgi:hypothetical protein